MSKDQHAFFFLETIKGKPKVNFVAYAKMGGKYAVLTDSGGGPVTTSEFKQHLADFRKKHTLYDYDDYNALEMHHLFKSKVSTFYNQKWFYGKYALIVRQLQVTATPKSFDCLFYLEAVGDKYKVGVLCYKRTKSGYVVNLFDGKMTDMAPKEDEMKILLAGWMKGMDCYRYSDYTPAKLYAIFKKKGVPVKYDLAWFEEQYDRIKKIKI